MSELIHGAILLHSSLVILATVLHAQAEQTSRPRLR